MNTATSSTQPEYELKHRLTGAAILMVLAVVVIPLLLSEPSLEANSKNASNEVSVQTFRSRIVPLNIDNINGASTDTVATVDHGGSSDAVMVDTRKPALLDLTDTANDGQTAAGKVKETKAGETKTALVMTKNQEAQESGSSFAASGVVKREVANAQSSADETPADKNGARSGDNSTASVDEETTAESGWVVRVGTFSKQANVDTVSSLLSNSGFNPKTKPVTTSLGKSTRVWLGPYAKRETADKISDRLKSLTGEKGYVTRNSS